jgi:DNA repair protein RecO (recombination protein O)
MPSGALVADRAMVLRWHKLGEADRIVVLLTAEHGKVRAVAKGVRKPGSKLGGRLEPLGHVRVQWWEPRGAAPGTLKTLTQADTIDAFAALRADLGRLTRALALAEAVDQLTVDDAEPAEAADRLRMLHGALRMLDTGDRPALVGAFFWKLLAADGVGPQLDACVACGTTDLDGPVGFDLDDGGLRCAGCRRGPALHPDTPELARLVLGGGLVQALAAQAGPAVTELEQLATRALERHLERRLRSVQVLHTFDG